jgi:hypothetical protein
LRVLPSDHQRILAGLHQRLGDALHLAEESFSPERVEDPVRVGDPERGISVPERLGKRRRLLRNSWAIEGSADWMIAAICSRRSVSVGVGGFI